MQKEINVKHKQAYDIEENWINNNPILLEGQLAYSSDKYGKYKIGNGESHWCELEYAGDIKSILEIEQNAVVKPLTDEYILSHSTLQEFFAGLDENTTYFYADNKASPIQPWGILTNIGVAQTFLGILMITISIGKDSAYLKHQTGSNDIYIKSYYYSNNLLSSQWTKILSNKNITKNDVGLGNVGNFKAVSTVASQGLNNTEKANALANIGAVATSKVLNTKEQIEANTDITNLPGAIVIKDMLSKQSQFETDLISRVKIINLKTGSTITAGSAVNLYHSSIAAGKNFLIAFLLEDSLVFLGYTKKTTSGMINGFEKIVGTTSVTITTYIKDVTAVKCDVDFNRIVWISI